LSVSPYAGSVVVLPEPTRDTGLVSAYATFCWVLHELEPGEDVTFYWDGFAPSNGIQNSDSFVSVSWSGHGFRYRDLSNDKERDAKGIWNVLVGLLASLEGRPLDAPDYRYSVAAYL